MKKILIILCCCLLTSLMALASSEKDILKCSELTQKAKSGYNPDVAISAIECNLKLDKEDLGLSEKVELENSMRENIVNLSVRRYEVTKDNNYIKKAYKYAFEAIDNGTKDVDVTKYAIMLAAIDVNTANMIKAYDYLCAIDFQAGQDYKNEYLQMLDNAKLLQQQNKQIKRQQWANVFNGISDWSYNQQVINQQNSPKTYTVTPMGNSLYINQW